MATRNNRRTIMTRQMLQDALIKLLQEKPISQITIKEVCKQADLNRTTFYLHYPHLDALLLDIQNTASDRIDEYLQSIQAEKDKINYIVLLLEYIKQNPSLFKILFYEDNFSYLQNQFTHHFLEVISGQAIQGATPEQTRYAKAFVTSGCIGLIYTWFENGFDISSNELAKQIFNMCDGAYRQLVK